MIKYVKINEDVQMHGAELEHGQVYPVERISHSTGMYTIRDASNWPYEFAPGEVTEVDAKFQPGDVVDWVDEAGRKRANNYWGESVVIERQDFKYSMEDDAEAYRIRNKRDGGIGLLHASELALHEEPKPDLRFHEYVEPEVDEIQDESLWTALNIEPNPAPKGKFFIMYDKPENPDAPTMKELSQAQDISGYATSFEFSLEDPNESQMLPDEEDVIGSPSHYTEGMPEGIEVRDIIKAQGFWMEFCAGNVIKYSMRWQYKNGIEDLKKMLQYGQWLVEELEDA